MRLVPWLQGFRARLSCGPRMIRRRRSPLETIPAMVVVAEPLESRTLFSGTAVWNGGGDGTSWNDPNNWSSGATPGAGDDVQIDLPGDVTVNFTSDNTEINSP